MIGFNFTNILIVKGCKKVLTRANLTNFAA
jgi:hypothetical protein